MATDDVPGFNPKNNDELSVGNWSEHKDGSLLYVEGVNDDRVIYSLFDLSRKPIIEYRDAMEIDAFKQSYSWKKGSMTHGLGIKWIWHDKTPFPWDRIIERKVPDGARFASAEEYLTVAKRIAKHRHISGLPMENDKLPVKQEDKIYKGKSTVNIVIDKIQNALNRLRA